MDARHPDRHPLRQEGVALKRGRWTTDALLVVVLFALAACVGTTYVRTVIAKGGKPRFYQAEFGPAVMVACGRGYINPNLDPLPDLNAFLATDVDRFACDRLPPQLATRPLSPMQRAFRYQELAVAITWRLAGLSWRSLAALDGLLFALTVTAAYGLFRTVMGPTLASAGALALTGSTIHLIYLPHLRDYSKAPFLLAAILSLAWIVRAPMRPRWLIALGAWYGLLIGVGIGFRNDLLIAVPPFIASVLVFLPGSLLAQWRVKLTVLAACGATLWLAMFPMRAIYTPGGGNSMQHVLVLGLGEPFNDDLGVTNGGLYGWGYEFKDEYAHALASGYATRMFGTDHALALYGPEYDRASSAYLAAVATRFPADMLVRVYAAVIKTLAIPYNPTSLQPPTLVTNPRIVHGYHLRERVLRALGGAWPWVIGLALVGLTIPDPRLAAFVAGVAFYFAAYPVLQFNERHFFHLEFMAWWALGLIVQQGVALAGAAAKAPVRRMWREQWWTRRWVRPLRTSVIAWVVAGALALAPLWILRAYQQRHVLALFNQYLALDREPLGRETVPAGPGLVRMTSTVQAAAAADRGDDAVRSTYLVAEFAAGACEALKFDVTFRYLASPPAYDFSRTIPVHPPLSPGGVRRLFFPVYAHPRPSHVIGGSYSFGGLELPSASAPCLSGLYRVQDVSGVPLLLDLNLPADWERLTLYQTIAELEARRNGEALPDVYTFPPDLAVGRSLLTSEVVPLTTADIERQSPTVSMQSRVWTVDGIGGVGGRGPFLYLAETKPRAARRGDLVLARGRLDHGGLSLGLVRDGQWVAQVPVFSPGEFLIVIQVPEDGAYRLVLANNLPGRSLDNRLTLQRIGWASPQ